MRSVVAAYCNSCYELPITQHYDECPGACRPVNQSVVSWFQSQGFPHLNRRLPAAAFRLVQRSAESLAKHRALPPTSPEVMIAIYLDQIHSTHRT